ncbi:MAG: C25 family cysteine peptidase [Bacteroidota bacterium]
MKHLLIKSFFSFTLLFFSITLFAGEIILNNGKTGVTYGAASYQQISFNIELSTIQYQEVQTNKGPFTELIVPGFGFLNGVGDPKLPAYHKLIEVPLNAEYEVLYDKIQYSDYELSKYGVTNPVIPAQAPLCKNITNPGEVPFILNSGTYNKDQYFGTDLVSIQNAGIMRSVKLATLTVSPILYNPVNGKIRVFTSMEVTIRYKHPDVAGTMQMKKRTASPYFGKLYNLFPNYQSNEDNLITTGPVTYVIVSDPAFHNALQPFIQWKIKKGFKVIDNYTNNPAVGNTTASIRNYLMNLYNNPPTGVNVPSFVLLVGDVGQIPTFTAGGHPSDLNYCEYTGDHIPEVFYGRFAAGNLAQLQPYLDKTMEYEQYIMPNPDFLNEVSMIAGADATNGPIYGNGQINYGTSTYFNTAHNLNSHTYLQPEPGGSNYSQHIRDDVSNGVSFSNYTAHGSEQGWADPQFVISQIPALQNNQKYCLMVGNCCKTSNFAVTCFAKEITRAANKGAVGYIGCSDYSYWDEDYWWACGFKAISTNPSYNPQHLGAYDATFHDHGEPISKWFVTMGQMVMAGDLAVQESTSGMKNYYWETYCLMGDPSLSIYYSVPQPVAATYPGSLPFGTHSLAVTTEPYAYVSLSINDTVLLDAKCADSIGIANLNFDTINQNCYLHIVISKQNRKPLIDSIQVTAFAVNVQASQTLLCRGDSSQLNVNINGGSGNYSYLWSPPGFLSDPTIANPLAVPDSTINYTVAVNDGNAIVNSMPLQLTVKPSPPIPIITLSDDSLVSSVATGNQWYRYQEVIPGAIGQSFHPILSGDYSTRITNLFNGCYSQSNIIPYYLTGFENNTAGINLQIWPNPVSDQLNIQFNLLKSGRIKISLIDLVGKVSRVFIEKDDFVAGEHSFVLNFKGFNPDIWMIKLETNEFTIVKRIILAK